MIDIKQQIIDIKKSQIRRWWRTQNKYIPPLWEQKHGQMTHKEFWEMKWNDSWDCFVEEHRERETNR